MSKRISWCHCHVPLWFFRATLTCQIWHTFDTPGPAPLGAEIWNLARTSHWMISGFWMSSVLANASEVWWKAHTAWTASVFVMGIGKLDGNGASKTYCPELKLLKVWKGAGHRSSGILNMVQKLHNTWDFHWFHMISCYPMLVWFVWPGSQDKFFPGVKPPAVWHAEICFCVQRSTFPPWRSQGLFTPWSTFRSWTLRTSLAVWFGRVGVLRHWICLYLLT